MKQRQLRPGWAYPPHQRTDLDQPTSAEREQALKLMLTGLEVLADTDNPPYKRGSRERTLAESEMLKSAAKTLHSSFS